MERLRAGPVVTVEDAAIIPVIRLSSHRFERALCGALTPLVVVVVRAGEVTAWSVDGQEVRAEEWLEAVPQLAQLVSRLQ